MEGLTLTVDSVAKSVEFYGGLLGLDVAYVSEPAFAMIKVPGAVGGIAQGRRGQDGEI